MKNFITKTLVILLVLFVSISLTACEEENTNSYNKNTPYGTLSNDTIYASIGDIKLSEKALYDELRGNGYDYLFEEFINVLIKPTDYNLTVENNREELIDIVNEKCFGTSEQDKLDEMNSATRAKYIAKYVDAMYLSNVVIENNEIHSDAVLEYYLKDLSRKYFAKGLLYNENDIYFWANEFQQKDGEFVLDENGEKIKNIYYIDDESIASAYNSNKDSEETYEVVIVGYNTTAEAQKALELYNKDELTYEDFKELYNNRYEYKEESDSNFLLTNKDLGVYNSSLVSLVKNMKKGDAKLFQQFGNAVYHVYLAEEIAENDYDSLSDADKITAKKETVEEIINDKLTSSVISSLVVDKVYNTEVVIYDYVYDALYASENTKHNRLAANQWKDEYNNYVAKVGETYITVADFYNTLEKLLGLTTAMDYFTSKVLLNSEYASKLTDKDLKEINEEYNEIISAFEQNGYATNGLPASIGKDVFLFVYFGNTDEASVKEYYKSQKIWEYYKEDKPAKYYELAEAFGKQYYENYFDLSVKHILLTVDYNFDGTADDPEIYASKLSTVKQEAFTTAVVTAMDAIVKEVNYIVDEDYASLTEALDYVLREYYANGSLLSDKTKTWAEYKSEFNLGLTIEDLSSVNSSTASKYVKEFGIGVKELYAEIGNTKDDYLAESVTDIKDLIQTNYGYHILGVYNSGKASSAKYTEDNDSSDQYLNIKVQVNGKLETIENAYSNNDWASVNQIKIYEAQVNTEDGITDLPSAVKSYISNFYTEFKSRFENETFQNILLAETELDINFIANQAMNEKYTKFIQIQKNQLDSYEDFGPESISILANWWTLVDQYIINVTE